MFSREVFTVLVSPVRSWPQVPSVFKSVVKVVSLERSGKARSCSCCNWVWSESRGESTFLDPYHGRVSSLVHDPPESSKREEELSNTFWRFTIDLSHPETGAVTVRLLNEASSAWAIIETILARLTNTERDGATTAVREQLATKGERLQQTDAAQELCRKPQGSLNGSGSSRPGGHRVDCCSAAHTCTPLMLSTDASNTAMHAEA